MDVFITLAALLLASAVAGKPAPGDFSNAHVFNNTSVFTQVVPSNDLSVRDPIYITPALLFVGKSNGDILRCLYKDPGVCEMFYSYSISTGVTATVTSGEYLYASLANGVMLRCKLYAKDSCTTFNSMGSQMNALAVSGGYIHAGLQDGRMVRCDLHQPNACKTLNKFLNGIASLAATEKYIYAGLINGDKAEIWRCSLGSQNSCRLVNRASGYSKIVGMSAVEETVIGVTNGGTLFNCTRGFNCTLNSLSPSSITSVAIFDKSLYLMQDPKIWISKLKPWTFTVYDQHEGALSISFTYSAFKMQDRFVNEDKMCLTGARCPPYMSYYEINERPMLEVYVKGGKLYNSRGVLVDTKDADVGQSGRAAIFAMGADGQILLSNVHNSLLRSSSLFAGQPVAGAGEMVVEEGVIKTIRACSNHYQPTVELNQQVIDVLGMKGYTARIDSLPCCRGNNCGQGTVNGNIILDEVVII